MLFIVYFNKPQIKIACSEPVPLTGKIISQILFLFLLFLDVEVPMLTHVFVW